MRSAAHPAKPRTCHMQHSAAGRNSAASSFSCVGAIATATIKCPRKHNPRRPTRSIPAQRLVLRLRQNGYALCDFSLLPSLHLNFLPSLIVCDQ